MAIKRFGSFDMIFQAETTLTLTREQGFFPDTLALREVEVKVEDEDDEDDEHEEDGEDGDDGEDEDDD